MFPTVFTTLTDEVVSNASALFTDIMPFIGLIAGIAALGLVLVQLRRFIG